MLKVIVPHSLPEAVSIIFSSHPPYFTAHFADILLKNGKLPVQFTDQVKLTFDYYLQSIFTDNRVGYNIVADYIISLYGIEDSSVMDLLEQAALLRIEEIGEIEQFCKHNQIESPVLQNLYRIISARSVEKGDMRNAVQYGVQSHDRPMQQRVDKMLIDEALATDLNEVISQIDQLSFEVKNSSATVRFLTLFKSFRADIASGNLERAAVLMKQFIVQKTAPPEFWPTILEESVPIFQAEEMRLDYDTMTDILRAVDQITNQNYAKPLLYGEREKQLRLVLLSAVRKAFEF